MTFEYFEHKEADKERFTSNQWMHFTLPGDLQVVTRTGVVKIGIAGLPPGEEWRHEKILFYPKFPTSIFPKILEGPDAGKLVYLQIEQWTSLVTINAIGNDKTSVYAGWAVDNFNLNGTVGTMIHDYIPMSADIAVRDTDGKLYRLGYTITLKGRFTEPRV